MSKMLWKALKYMMSCSLILSGVMEVFTSSFNAEHYKAIFNDVMIIVILASTLKRLIQDVLINRYVCMY